MVPPVFLPAKRRYVETGWIMNAVCDQCGKAVTGEGMTFCPYCGAKLPAEVSGGEQETGKPEKEARQWVRKALAETAYPDRKRILQQGLAACPGSREILWELLFIGEEGSRRRGFSLDFSIIKSFILDIYLNPKNFTEEQKNRMRSQFYEDPDLLSCTALFENPEEKRREYIQRLCREYVEIFIENNSRLMGRIFGLQLDRNRERKLAAPVAQMIRRVREDEKLTPEQRDWLWKALYQACAARSGGNTAALDQLLES